MKIKGDFNFKCPIAPSYILLQHHEVHEIPLGCFDDEALDEIIRIWGIELKENAKRMREAQSKVLHPID